MQKSLHAALLRRFSALAALTAAALLTPSALPTGLRTASAQTLVATANGRPITSFDVNMRMKMLRVLKRPSSYDDAFESVVADQLELDNTKKYNIVPADQDILVTLNRDALKLKTNAQALVNAMQAAGVTQEHWHDHYRAQTAWLIYVHALNKDLEVSETDVRAEVAKNGGKGVSSDVFNVEQVIFVLPVAASASVVAERTHEAQQLRDRFTDCGSGSALARGLPNVAVKDPVSRPGSALDSQIRDMLDHTNVGHLTAPQRTNDGIVMLAVCSKSQSHDDTTADEDIRSNLLADRIDAEAAVMYKQLRASAVVVKR